MRPAAERIIREHGVLEVHATVPAGERRQRPTPNPELSIGLDAGMSEVFATSEGEFIGVEQGAIIDREADTRRDKGRRRGVLHSLARKHESQAEAAQSAGDDARARHHRTKARNLREHNLGKVKMSAQRTRRRAQIKALQYEAVHAICDTYGDVVCERLDIRGGGKRASKQQSNRLSSWQRSSLKTALESVTRRRGSALTFVNPAYTSQQLNTCGHLGVRAFDVVYCDTPGCRSRGDRQHADVNAARNILDRKTDTEITLYTPHTRVREILLSRVSTNHPGHENPASMNSSEPGQSVSESPDLRSHESV